MATVVQISNLVFQYPTQSTPVIDISDFKIQESESVFLHGPSGQGKTTFLSLLSGLFLPQAGHINILGTSLTSLKSGARDRFRAKNMGVVFQIFNLIPYLSVSDNVKLPSLFGRSISPEFSSAEEESLHLLKALGLEKYYDRPITTLSIGQQQRVALARALYGSPQLLIADEPTSSLDSEAKENFLTLLFSQCTKSKTSLLFVSHDMGLARRFDKAVALSDINHPASSRGERVT